VDKVSDSVLVDFITGTMIQVRCLSSNSRTTDLGR